MASNITALNSRKRIRRNFGSIHESVEMPNLIEVQRRSYDIYLQRGVDAKQREDVGLQAVFKSVFPIEDFSKRISLEFVSYELEKPKYDVEECQQRDLTYASPLKVMLRLVVWEEDEITGQRSLRDIKEQDVYMGDMPLMTDKGTFVINGTERVIVSQMHRSPGVFFDHDRGKNHASGKLLYAARVIPYRGSWLDFEFDAKDMLYVRIDRKRKLPATTFLMALLDDASEAYVAECAAEGIETDRMRVNGMSRESILNYFYDTASYEKGKKGWHAKFIPERYRGIRLVADLVNAKTGKTVANIGDKLTPRALRKLSEEGLEEVLLSNEEIIDNYLAYDIVDKETGRILAEAGDIITEETLSTLDAIGITSLTTLVIDNINVSGFLRHTLSADKNHSRDEALKDIYRIMRPGEPPMLETAENLFKGLFFDEGRYDLSSVGRVKLNARVGIDVDDQIRILRREDILSILRVLIDLKDGKGEIDDIDHLGNRRVRSVGELMENQYRMGLVRMERSIKERMSSAEIDTAMPADLINSKPAATSVQEFFSSSQLSQFMDQTNPLSEITHKRRLSALGPGGLTRDRAGFEVRDVHPTHYGRICPIETPEGPNIGLINSLATFAHINRYGFIETPYRSVKDGKVTDEVSYISAIDEGRYTIAQANAELDDDGCFVDELIPVRRAGEIGLARSKDIQLMDVSPKQLVSVAASLIPFLENDDANRALMGSNMQRQAVPLVKAEAPMVGTGMEAVVASDSGVAIVARRTGIIDQVDATRIVVRATETDEDDVSPVDIYSLLKFNRSNQSTCITQRPLVKVGDVINAGDIIANGPSTEDGELALGRNVLVAFMPWNGYNFEDSILISERIVKDDVFTSIHIEEYEVVARDTKLGMEEITRDISNVGEEALRNLDEAGIVYVGAKVKGGDILVGKVTPKSETPMIPEEKLLRAIFGEKSIDARDTSLTVPPGGSPGTVVDVRIFSRRGVAKDERAKANERLEIERLAKDRNDERAILERGFYGKLEQMLVGMTAASNAGDIKVDTKITAALLNDMPSSRWVDIAVKNSARQKAIEAQIVNFETAKARLEDRFNDKVDKLQSGDELKPGVMKMVKVFVAVKRKLQPGDKMAGRHGNKGVVSRIMPVEDMPYLEDGTPVDIVLNPLGVPSRMNVGQILETHLGWASAGLGRQIGEVVEQAQRSNNVEGLRKNMQEIYPKDQFSQSIAEMDDEKILEQGKLLSRGVPMGTPVFDGAVEADVRNLLKQAGLSETGQEWLTDGRTGEVFDRPVTVGYIYMMKLHHLVDEKLHARSTGPYSLVTQQPLGGKAQFGGQRVGEMEVWALEAYGAAYTLQEMLTVKSDDIAGRTDMFEAILREKTDFKAGTPESFNVLIKELRSLGLSIDYHESEY